MKIRLGKIVGTNRRFAIVVSRFNEFITRRLLTSAIETLKQAGVKENHIEILWVPGALEVPFFLKKMARRKRFNALIALGCVIRGETFHFENVASEVTRGISQVSLEEGVPVATAILTVDNLEQAIDRAGLKGGNKGAQAALAALEISDLNCSLSKQSEK